MAFDFLIPVSTNPDPTPRAGLRRALDLAPTMSGRVTALVHEVDIPPLHNFLAEAVLDLSAMAAEAEALSRSRGEVLLGELRQLAEFFRLPLAAETVRCRRELLPDRIAHAARTHDYALLVLDPQSPDQRDMAEGVIFGSGGPAILFPALEVPAHLLTVVIAWDGSRAAARAVRDAMPVLKLGKHVVVATFEDEKPLAAAGLAELQRHLKEHGVAARHVQGTAGSAPVGDAIQELALSLDAGLLVMGAYGHNRMREFVLGGATRSVLHGVRLPILVSH